MSFNFITAAEAASLIKDGEIIGLSGFTPAGSPKAVTAELAKNEVNFTIEENNGQIIINQNTDTINQKLQEQVEQYNRKLENSKSNYESYFNLS